MVHILDNLSSKHCSDLQKLSLICYVPMWQNKSLVDTKKAIKKIYVNIETEELKIYVEFQPGLYLTDCCTYIDEMLKPTFIMGV